MPAPVETKPWSSAVAAIVRGELRRRGVADYRAALESGFARTRFSNLVQGAGKWTVDDVAQVCAYLGWTVGDLIESARLIVDGADDLSDRRARKASTPASAVARTGERDRGDLEE